MKLLKSVGAFFILFALLSCENNKETSVVNSSNDTLATETLMTSLANDSAALVNVEQGPGEESQLFHIVSVAEGTNYKTLREIAINASKFLKLRFDTLERYYNSKKQRIVLPDNHTDEIYAGDYYLRRYDDGFVSIEMRNAYMDTNLKDDAEVSKFYNDSTKMFVFAAMYGEKKQADSLVNILKKEFKTSKIITSYIYMGCMH